MGGVMKHLIPSFSSLTPYFQPSWPGPSGIQSWTLPLPNPDYIIPCRKVNFLKKLTKLYKENYEVPQNRSLLHFTILVVVMQGSSQSPISFSPTKSYKGPSTVCFFVTGFFHIMFHSVFKFRPHYGKYQYFIFMAK